MNFYVVLGVRREASAEEVRRAYRRLARRYHPDINPGDRAAVDAYRQITEAYETLVDPVRRREYDAHQEPSAPAAVAGDYRFAGFDFTMRVDGPKATSFGELFVEPLPGVRPERGADLHATLDLSLEEVAHGAERRVTLTRLEKCGPCGGRGVITSPEVPCRICEGTGELRTARGHMVFRRVCTACAGQGVTRQRPCTACGGEGVGVRADAVTVTVPPGLDEGALLTLPGEGHAGRRGGLPGDLRLVVHLLPHPVFARDGHDLSTRVPIAVHEAALGARIEVPGLDGPVRLRVPPGTQSGQTFRLRERGLPSARNGSRGDQVVTVHIVLPSVLDERSKALLEEFGRLHPEDVRKSRGA